MQGADAVLDREEDRRRVLPGRFVLPAADDDEPGHVVAAVLDVAPHGAQAVEFAGQTAGDRGPRRVRRGAARGLGGAGDIPDRDLREVRLKPLGALRDGLVVRVQDAHVPELSAFREQVVVNDEHDLGVNRQRRLEEHVQRVVHHALGGILHGNDAECGLVALDRAEHLADAGFRQGARGGAEDAPAGLVGEGRLGAEVGDGERLLDLVRRGEDLPVDAPEGFVGERAGVRLLDAGDHLLLAPGVDDLDAPVFLDLADRAHDRGAPVEQGHQLPIDRVDPLAVRADALAAVGRGLSGFHETKGADPVRGPRLEPGTPRRISSTSRSCIRPRRRRWAWRR